MNNTSTLTAKVQKVDSAPSATAAAAPVPASAPTPPTSSWAKGPPSFIKSPPPPASTPAANGRAAGSSSSRPSSVILSNGLKQPSAPANGSGTPPAAAAAAAAHARKPSAAVNNNTQPSATPSEIGVTLSKNIPNTTAGSSTSLNFGSIGDSNAPMSASPARAPSLTQSNLKEFGSIKAEGTAPTPPVSAPSAAGSNPPASASSESTTPAAVAASTVPKQRKKFDVMATFQTPSSQSASPAASASASAPIPTPPLAPNGISSPASQSSFVRSPAMSPRVIPNGLPNGVPHGATMPAPPAFQQHRPPQGAQNPGRSPALGRQMPNSANGPGPHNNGMQPQHNPRNSMMGNMHPNMPSGAGPSPGGPGSPRPGQSVPNFAGPQNMYYSQQHFHPSQMPAYYDPNGAPQYASYAMGYPPSPLPSPHLQGGPQMGGYQYQQQGPPQMGAASPRMHHAQQQGGPPHHGGGGGGGPGSAGSRTTPQMGITGLPPHTPTMANRQMSLPPQPHSAGPNQSSFHPNGSPGSAMNVNASSFKPRRTQAITIKRPDGTVVGAPTLKPANNLTSPSPVTSPAGGHKRTQSSAIQITAPSPAKAKVDEEAKAKAAAEAKAKEEKEKKEQEEREAAEKQKALEAEEEAKKKAEEERIAKEKAEAEAEAARKAKEEQERLEAEKRAAEEKEAARLAAEEEERKRKEEEEEKKKAAEEAEAKAKAEKEAEEKAKAEAEAEEAAAKKKAEEEAAAAADVAAASAKAEAEHKEMVRLAEEREAAASSSSTPAPGGAGGKRLPPAIDTNTALVKASSPAPRSALATARKITSFSEIAYPAGIQSPVSAVDSSTMDSHFRYSRDFLTQFMDLSIDPPENMADVKLLKISRDSTSNDAADLGASRRGSRPGGMGLPPRAGSSHFIGGDRRTSSMGPPQMGSFAKPSSSDMRFQAATARGAGLPGRSGLSRPPSLGGPGSVPPNSRDPKAGRAPSKRGRPRDMPAPQQNTGAFGLEPVAPLQATENAWKPTAGAAAAANAAPSSDSPQLAERKVKALLNKLTMEKFDKLSDQVIEWANKSEKESDGATLMLVIRLVFEKATDEAAWSEMYARLCRKMMERISPNVKDESVAGGNGAGGQLFRKYLLNRCQLDFERGWAVREAAGAAAADKAADDEAAQKANEGKGDGETVLYSDEYYAAEKAKRRGLGLVKFIGELFKLQMLSEKIMHICIQKLLSNTESPEEEDIESLCRLLSTVGKDLDTERAQDHIDKYFEIMKAFIKNGKLSSRVQFMVQDVLELRQRQWQPRIAVAAPSTIAQVHAAAARDEATSAAARQASMSSISRGGSRRGDRRDDQDPNGWNTTNNSTRTTGNLNKFGKFNKDTPSANVPDPKNPFALFTRAKSGAGPGGAATPPAMSRAPSTAKLSGANMFSILKDDAPADHPPAPVPSSRGPSRKSSLDLGAGGVPEPERKKIVLAPRTKPIGEESEEGEIRSSKGDDEDDEGEGEEGKEEELTEAEAQARIAEDTKEFWNTRNIDEATHYFVRLPAAHHHLLVEKFAGTALDKKEADVVLVSDLFSRVSSDAQCSKEAFEQGLLPFVESVDDLSVDVPKAYAFVARLLHGSKLERSTVDGLSEKIVVDGDPLVPPAKKLIKEYEKL